jgi:hypothetical protein
MKELLKETFYFSVIVFIIVSVSSANAQDFKVSGYVDTYYAYDNDKKLK